MANVTSTIAFAFAALALLAVFFRRQNSRQAQEFESEEKSPKVDGKHERAAELDLIRPVGSDFAWDGAAEMPYRPWKNGPHYVTMGLQKTNLEGWIEIDRSYMDKYRAKKRLIDERPKKVTCALPECYDAALEALHWLADVLTSRYPMIFVKSGAHTIRNLVTGDLWDLTPCSTTLAEYHPLEVMGMLATEDFFILENDSTTGLTALKGGCVCFPAGWKIEERVGLSLWQIHAGKVPHYEQALSKSMDRFFLRMKCGSLMSRFNYAIDDSGDLHRRHSHHNQSDDHNAPLLQLEDLHLRVERQVLQRLPQTGAILFSIRTYVTPITDVTKDKAVAEALRTSVRSYDTKQAAYKNQPLWDQALQKHLDEILEDVSKSDSLDEKVIAT